MSRFSTWYSSLSSTNSRFNCPAEMSRVPLLHLFEELGEGNMAMVVLIEQVASSELVQSALGVVLALITFPSSILLLGFSFLANR